MSRRRGSAMHIGTLLAAQWDKVLLSIVSIVFFVCLITLETHARTVDWHNNVVQSTTMALEFFSLSAIMKLNEHWATQQKLDLVDSRHSRSFFSIERIFQVGLLQWTDTVYCFFFSFTNVYTHDVHHHLFARNRTISSDKLTKTIQANVQNS